MGATSPAPLPANPTVTLSPPPPRLVPASLPFSVGLPFLLHLPQPLRFGRPRASSFPWTGPNHHTTPVSRRHKAPKRSDKARGPAHHDHLRSLSPFQGRASTPHLSAPTSGHQALWINIYTWLLACGSQLQLLGNIVKKSRSPSSPCRPVHRCSRADKEDAGGGGELTPRKPTDPNSLPKWTQIFIFFSPLTPHPNSTFSVSFLQQPFFLPPLPTRQLRIY